MGVVCDQCDYDFNYRSRIGFRKGKANCRSVSGRTDSRRIDLVWKGDSAFLGLFAETYLEKRHTAIILIHGMGAHPDWPDVISPLRWELPGNKLPTLSIQMPILSAAVSVSAYGRTLKEAARRINIAVNYLHEHGFSRVILVGYSFGAATAAYYLANNEQHKVSAFVGISMLARKFLQPELKLELLLEQIDVPMFDIYGSHDLDEILRAVPDRRLAARKSGNVLFKQVEIQGSDHIHVGYENELVTVIVDWITQHNQLKDKDIVSKNKQSEEKISNMSE